MTQYTGVCVLYFSFESTQKYPKENCCTTQWKLHQIVENKNGNINCYYFLEYFRLYFRSWNESFRRYRLDSMVQTVEQRFQTRILLFNRLKCAYAKVIHIRCIHFRKLSLRLGKQCAKNFPNWNGNSLWAETN